MLPGSLGFDVATLVSQRGLHWSLGPSANLSVARSGQREGVAVVCKLGKEDNLVLVVHPRVLELVPGVQDFYFKKKKRSPGRDGPGTPWRFV